MKHPTTSGAVCIGILFGGKSAEHDISLLSAKNVAAALASSKFSLKFIYIDRQGGWHAAREAAIPDTHSSTNALDPSLLRGVDVVFPVLHGPMGEDGTVQGFLETMGIPYVGCGILSSAVTMDKDIAKRLLRDAGIPVARHIVVRTATADTARPTAIIKELGLPLFVKPANMGSSIGVSKVTTEQDLQAAVKEALRYDRKVIIEQAVVGSEIECAILGNDAPETSAIGRIIPAASFYTYDAKYKDEQGTVLEIPAALSPKIVTAAQQTALRAYQALECSGLARVDMFLSDNGDITVNEINAMPGFTQYSMYPQLWQQGGVNPTELTTRLIELALERS